MNIKITVFDDDCVEDRIPKDIKGFMVFIQNEIDKIPDEYKDSAEIRFEPVVEWDCPYLSLEITYMRPATDEELQDIERTNKNRQEYIKRYELEQLRILQERYKSP